MRNLLISGILTLLIYIQGHSQDLQVTTIARNLNASGGVTMGADGNIYVSDFGAALGQVSENTSVYQVRPNGWKSSVYASGFKGASGACFDRKGNFYQSNPFGNRVSKVTKDGRFIAAWASEGLRTPIGMVAGPDDQLFVCNCGNNSISRIHADGKTEVFAQSSDFNCPNGLTIDPEGILYACNFNDGNVLRIDQKGNVSILNTLPELPGNPRAVGNGHLTWKNGWLYVVTIGRGELYRVNRAGEYEWLAGKAMAFTNEDGSATEATFCKPNGIAASITGDTLFINVSDAPWNNSNPLALHPAHLRMVTGLNSLSDIRNEQRTGPGKSEDDREAILETSKRFSSYYVNARYDSLANTYTVNGRIFPDGAPIIEGREAIRKRWILPEGVRVLKHVVTPEEIRINGDYAYDYGYYTVETKRADGSVVTGKGKYVIVWQKVDGVWKIHLDIWNRVRE